MKKNRNITQKSAPVIPPAQTEPKRIKLSPAMQATAIDAMQRFRAAVMEANRVTKEAETAQKNAMELGRMHDNLFKAIVEDGGASVEDFQHGFELREGFLCAKPAPSQE